MFLGFFVVILDIFENGRVVTIARLQESLVATMFVKGSLKKMTPTAIAV
jgi:hypothetical protein